MTNYPNYPPQWPPSQPGGMDIYELREIGKAVARVEVRISEQHIATVERLSAQARRMDGIDKRMETHEKSTARQLKEIQKEAEERLTRQERWMQRIMTALVFIATVTLKEPFSEWVAIIRPVLSGLWVGK